MATSKQSKDLIVESDGVLENKDLTDAVAPLESPAPFEGVVDGIEVKLVHHLTYEGKNLLPGTVVVLPGRLASSLVSQSWATYL